VLAPLLSAKLELVEDVSEREISSAFLILDGEAVYEIASNSVMNIGRLESNDVILDDYKVSREHAVLKFVADEFTLVDLASTHGTFVNGARIDRAPVRFGDRIQIINHELILSREMPDDHEDYPSVSAPKMARSLDRRLKFFGGLNDFALITLVQFLSQEKQSGLLLLELGQSPGPRIYFQDGEIIHVSDGANLADLLTRVHHDRSLFFYFHHETNFPLRTIKESTANYLMNLCHDQDQRRSETGRLAAMAQVTGPLSATKRLDP
jgi:hypothetical protein